MKVKRGALMLALALAFGSSIAGAQLVPDFDQGWTPEDRAAWYDASQGSRLIPLIWLKALEQPASSQLFLSDDYISRFRYLPRTNVHGDRLPLGFARDITAEKYLSNTKLHWYVTQQGDEPWVGMNCAACHTGEIKVGNSRFRLEGVGTGADFQSFMEALDTSAIETSKDDGKFERFAARVLLGKATPDNKRLLRGALGKFVEYRIERARLNHTTSRYGFGRLDAFGHIFNQLALNVKDAAPIPNPSDAPVSYPFLWNVPQLDKVQWNGIAMNKAINSPIGDPFDVGALGRNTGEVIGVFADVSPRASAGLSGYNSSVAVENLAAMEQMLRRLRPPRWPADILGTPDRQLTYDGYRFFSEKCASCHVPLDRTDLNSKIPLRISLFGRAEKNTPPGTDPWMACNAYTYRIKTGVMANTREKYLLGPPLGKEAYASDVLTAAVAGTLAGKKAEVVRVGLETFFGVERQRPSTASSLFAFTPRTVVPLLDTDAHRLSRCMNETSSVLGYLSRPLTGIWATAPYLHNGSVPTLFDLLLPPSQRPKTFFTGAREFDPVKVGFVTTQSEGNSVPFKVVDESGAIVKGNDNAGHDYGNANLSDYQRRALVEYLKTL